MSVLKQVPRWILNVILLLIFFVPFYWMALTSIKSLSETMQFPPSFLVLSAQWSNFVQVFQEVDFLHYLKNSCIITAAIMIAQFATSIPAAYAFARYKFRGRQVFFGAVLATMMVPAQLIFVPIFLLLSHLGLINTYWSLILPQATSAFGIFMLRQAFMQVPEEILEAARMDRASEFAIIRKIMLPMAGPSLAMLALVTFIGAWNDYFWPLILTTNETVRTLPVGITMLRNVESGVAYNVVMAGNLLMLLPILVVYLLAQKQIIKAFSYTGVK